MVFVRLVCQSRCAKKEAASLRDRQTGTLPECGVQELPLEAQEREKSTASSESEGIAPDAPESERAKEREKESENKRGGATGSVSKLATSASSFSSS